MEGLALMEALRTRRSALGAREAFFAACVLPFVLLCTLNSAMYRYGASDQAFYQPAVVLEQHPEYFPRDAPLILAQARLTGADEVVAGLAALTGASLPVLFAMLYVVSLLLLAIAAWLIGGRIYRTAWTGVALLSALTLRHGIWRTGTNTLEGYFHPRQLAFGFGALAVAAILRRRPLAAAAAIAVAAVIHPTTAMWFAIWMTAAVAVSQPRWRIPLGLGVAAVGIFALWVVVAGPLAGRLVRIDPEWLATLATKDYLFPLEWPAAAWVLNLLPLPVILLVYVRRRRAGLADGPETGVAIGALSLAVVFAAILPLNAARVALAVQLQPARMFWMMDFMATIYLVWALAEGTSPSVRRARLVAVILLSLSVVRGVYLKVVEFPERAIARFDIREDDWGRAMAWARETDTGSGWLADPGHAVLYGTSLRVAAGRDVLVEAVKDAAIGMYDRSVAIRTRDRISAAGDFGALTADRAREIGSTYDLDYLIAEQELDLPLAFQSGKLRIYRLR
jgi:hypothetical protein